MPVTAGLMLLGFLALAALPPLNGFVSEWLLLQALLSLGLMAPGWLTVLAGLAAAGLALTGALTVATGVKAIGIGFLGLPRSPSVNQAHEASALMLAPMMVLAVLCLVIGLLPGLASGLVGPVGHQFGLAPAPVGGELWRLALDDNNGGRLSPLLLALGLVVLAPLPWLLLRGLMGPVPRRIEAAWVCGEALSPRMQYTAASFSKPIRLIFKAIIQPVRTVAVAYQGSGRFFLERMVYHGETRPLAERYLYATVQRAVLALARATRGVQNGSTRLYLTYIFVTLVLLLLLAR
jgi:hydrogenase-4 component B